MDRRRFLQSGVAATALTVGPLLWTALAQERAPAAGGGVTFSYEWLVEQARLLADEEFQEKSASVPESVADLTYDQFRNIWFQPEAAIWLNEPAQFRLDLFHLGFVYREPVRIALIENGQATEIPFSTDLFAYGHLVQPPQETEGLGFSGFRARFPINHPDAFQEFLVFQGASYFRSVGRNQLYGLSARGLAIDTASPDGEEFPIFRGFFIEKPAPDSVTLVVNALLDSASVTGAYRFEIMPGAETVIEVEATIFSRLEMEKVGIAPLTSMFLFNSMNRSRFDDYRRAVHDSEGLQLLTGAGEWIWRPLANPVELQVSQFVDATPRGFGLIQRSRTYEAFADAEARYERRPSLWIEPIGDWGKGFVELVEIPTDSETNDNIVAYWNSGSAMPAGESASFSYRMRWTDATFPPPELLAVMESRAGLSFDEERRLFVVDFKAANGSDVPVDPKDLVAHVKASRGEVLNIMIHEAQPNGMLRVSFELDPLDEAHSELRLILRRGDEPASETWLYRWTAS